MLKEHLRVKSWGNSKAMRIPNSVAKQIDIHLEDEFTVEVDEKNRIILTKILPIEASEPNELTVAELFSEYNGESFTTEIQNLDEARGNEKW